MANTIVAGGRQIRITGLDADFLYSTNITGVTGSLIALKSISFVPSAANDRMIVHDESLDGAELFDTGVVSGTDARTKYFDPPHWCNPYLDISDCTLSNAANAKLIFETA